MYREPLAHRYLDVRVADLHHELLMDHLLGSFGLEVGNRVVEVGAGSGRYTEMLLGRGLEVVATEPDPRMRDKLASRLDGVAGFTAHAASADELLPVARGADLICGFHVLHHLDKPSLLSMRDTFLRLKDERADFRGWFFLEPNPLNPFYPIQIALTKGMSFSEEAGTWRPRARRLLSESKEASVWLGNVGFFPPRRILGSMPERVLRMGTTLRKRWSPLRAYSVYGERY